MQQLKQVTETKCVTAYHLTSAFPLPPNNVKPVTEVEQQSPKRKWNNWKKKKIHVFLAVVLKKINQFLK